MKTNKKYLSIYGAKSKTVRPDQYLVELIIKRRADKQNIKLPDRFWSKEYGGEYDYWTKIFGSELRHSKPLFTKYDPDCIIEAFQSFDCQYILSSTNKQLNKIAKEFQRRKDLLDSVKEVVEVVTTNTDIIPRRAMGKPNKRSKLV